MSFSLLEKLLLTKVIELRMYPDLCSNIYKNLILISDGEVILNFLWLHFSTKLSLFSNSYVFLSKKNSRLKIPANSLNYPLDDSINRRYTFSSSSRIILSSWILVFNLFYYSMIFASSKVGITINVSSLVISPSSLGFTGFKSELLISVSYKIVYFVMSSPWQ